MTTECVNVMSLPPGQAITSLPQLILTSCNLPTYCSRYRLGCVMDYIWCPIPANATSATGYIFFYMGAFYSGVLTEGKKSVLSCQKRGAGIKTLVDDHVLQHDLNVLTYSTLNVFI